MRGLFKKLAAFFHSHPGIKTTAVGVAGAALSAAGTGTFGPKGQAAAAAVAAVAGLWVKRPADATSADKAGIAVGDVVKLLHVPEAGEQLMTVTAVLQQGDVFLAACTWFEGNSAKAAVYPVSDLTEVTVEK